MNNYEFLNSLVKPGKLTYIRSKSGGGKSSLMEMLVLQNTDECLILGCDLSKETQFKRLGDRIGSSDEISIADTLQFTNFKEVLNLLKKSQPKTLAVDMLSLMPWIRTNYDKGCVVMALQDYARAKDVRLIVTDMQVTNDHSILCLADIALNTSIIGGRELKVEMIKPDSDASVVLPLR